MEFATESGSKLWSGVVPCFACFAVLLTRRRAEGSLPLCVLIGACSDDGIGDAAHQVFRSSSTSDLEPSISISLSPSLIRRRIVDTHPPTIWVCIQANLGDRNIAAFFMRPQRARARAVVRLSTLPSWNSASRVVDRDGRSPIAAEGTIDTDPD